MLQFINECEIEPLAQIVNGIANYYVIVHIQVSIVGESRDREVACSASDRQGSNFESCVWRTVSSQSSHHPQEVILDQLSLYVQKGGLKPDSFHFYRSHPSMIH